VVPRPPPPPATLAPLNPSASPGVQVASEEAAATSELHSSFCVWQVSVYNNRGRLGKLRGVGVGKYCHMLPATWRSELRLRCPALFYKIVSIELRCHLAIDAKILRICVCGHPCIGVCIGVCICVRLCWMC